MVRVRSQRPVGGSGEGREGGQWGRHESGILGRVVLGVGEVSSALVWVSEVSS